MTTIVDLELNADSSSLDQAIDSLKKAAIATKELTTQQLLLTNELKKMNNGFQDVDRSAGKVNSTLSAATSIGKALGLAIGSAATAITYFSIRTINSMDALNDLADATGASVDKLSLLQDVAQRTGVEFATVEAAMVKFNAQLTAAEPNSNMDKVLKSIGLNTKELKEMDPADALRRTAEALNQYADNGNKARITQEIFGKSTKDVAAYLKDLAAETATTGSTTAAAAAEAEKFNKQIYGLQTETSILAKSILKELVPSLTTSISEFTKIAKEAGIAQAALISFGGAIARTTRTDEIGRMEDRLVEGAKKAKQYSEELDRALSLPGWLGGKPEIARKKLEDQIRENARMSEELKALVGVPKKEDVQPDKPNAPDTPKKPSTTPIEKPKTLDRELMSERQKLDALQGVSEEQQIINKYADDYYKKYPPKQVEELKNLELKELRIKQQKDAQAAAYEQSVKDFNLQTQIQDKHNSDLRNLKTDTDLRQIQIDVMKKFGATQTDVAIAQNAYNLKKAEELLLTRSAEGFRAGEEQALRNQIELLREKGKQLGATKSMDDTEADRQKTFSYGWEQSFDKYKETAENAATHAQSVFATASKGMEEAISNFVKTGKLDFASLTASIINNLIQIQAQKFTVNLLSGLFSANGNVFSNGNVLKSADGNVFDKPTLHGYSGGIGMLGEAGPESIMPLKRNAQGQLGVIAQGGGSSSNVTVTNNITVQGTNSSMKDSIEQAKLISNAIDIKIKQSLAKEQLPGGMLSGASRRF